MSRGASRSPRPVKSPVISERTWLGSQSWNHEVIEEVGARRVRYRIKVDAYDFQSYGVAESWHADGWHQIHRIPGPELVTRASYVRPGVTARDFEVDMAELRAVAAAVLS